MPWEQTQTQRFLTVDFITKRRLNAPAVWLNPQSRVSSAEDAVKAPNTLNTIPHDWLVETDDRNLAIRLVDGFIELQITAPDDIWNQNLFKAFRALRVDARAAFGSHQVSSILIKIDTPASIDRWRELWPRGHVDKNGRWVETKFAYSQTPTNASKAIWQDSKPLPGSIFGNQLVMWRPSGKPATNDAEQGLEDLEPRELAATNMESICRAIAFATLGYWIDLYLDGLADWDQSLTRAIGGWVARLVLEGRAINAQGKSLEGVCWSPIDDGSSAGELMNFLAMLGATKDLGVAFIHAERMLELNPQAPVPGWGAIETLFGPQAKVGIRRAFRAGLDLDAIERMSELYVYDRTMHNYLDRDELLKGLHFEHKGGDLEERHKNELVFIQGKPRNPFTLYSASSLRSDVQHREFRPGYEPGSFLRFSPVHGLVDDEDHYPDEYRVLNTFPGFVIKPIAVIDEAVMRPALTMLDRMLGFLTQDNDDQIRWLKQFIAWIAQHPEIKPQVCPIIVGGQGIGKSQFGESFMRALFGTMAGGAAADLLSDNKFVITPFLNKLITFIDEVRLESVGAINTIKKLVRADYVSGQLKHQDQRDYYVPTRLLIASNSPDIGLTPTDAADRAFFFIMSYTPENMRKTDREFLEWAWGLKPFYVEFLEALKGVAFRQHLMRYFMDFEVTRSELENLQYSSRNDENIVRSTMSKAREVARAIVADARVRPQSDINAWFSSTDVRDAIKRVDGARSKVEAGQVLMEFERAGITEVMRGDLRRFKWGYGKVIQVMSEAHNLPITPNWDYKPGDFDDNEIRSPAGGSPWRGLAKQQRPQYDRGTYDPDAMGPE